MVWFYIIFRVNAGFIVTSLVMLVWDSNAGQTSIWLVTWGIWERQLSEPPLRLRVLATTCFGSTRFECGWHAANATQQADAPVEEGGGVEEVSAFLVDPWSRQIWHEWWGMCGIYEWLFLIQRTPSSITTAYLWCTCCISRGSGCGKGEVITVKPL